MWPAFTQYRCRWPRTADVPACSACSSSSSPPTFQVHASIARSLCGAAWCLTSHRRMRLPRHVPAHTAWKCLVGILLRRLPGHGFTPTCGAVRAMRMKPSSACDCRMAASKDVNLNAIVRHEQTRSYELVYIWPVLLLSRSTASASRVAAHERYIHLS